MKISVLDHGYVELIEPWGVGKDGRDLRVDQEIDGPYVTDDCDFEVGIIEAARQSTQGSFRGWDQDQKLLTTLYHHQPNGSSPFEMAGMIIEVQAPIFVFREWHRHRTQSYNEASARYIKLPELYYHADQNNVLERAQQAQVEKNKQAGAGVVRQIDPAEIAEWLVIDEQLSKVLETHYQQGLAIGIPKELARKKMPVDHYSRMRAGAVLKNWLAFMSLRCDSAAQWEIRQFANAVAQIVEAKFPRTFALWKAEQ